MTDEPKTPQEPEAAGSECSAGLGFVPQTSKLPTLKVGQYDPWTDTIEIEGTTYSGYLFREGFGELAPIGQVLRIDKREDGVVTITRLYELENRA